MRLAKQLFGEFWIPTLIALTWTFYRWSVSTGDELILTVVSAFAPAFFLASWAIGQVLRIRKQQKVEDALDGLEITQQRIEASQQASQQATNKIVGLIEQVVQQTKDVPALQPIVQSLKTASTEVATANTAISTEVTAANNVISAIRSLPPMGWFSEWAVPQRGSTFNPALYSNPMSGAVPLPLKDVAKKQGDDGA